MKEAVYTLSESDYLAANRAHIRLQFATGTGWLLPLVVGVGFGFMAVSERAGSAPSQVMVALSITVGIWLALVVVTLLSLPRRSRDFYRQQRALGEETRFAWDAAGFGTASASATSRLRWDDVQRWAETDDALLLFTNALIFYPLPARAFAADDLADLRRRLGDHAVPQWRAWRHWRPPTRIAPAA